MAKNATPVTDFADVILTGSTSSTVVHDRLNNQDKVYDGKTGLEKRKTYQTDHDSFFEACYNCVLAASQSYEVFLTHMIVLTIAGAEYMENQSGPLEVLLGQCKIIAKYKDQPLSAFIAKFFILILNLLISNKRAVIVASLIWIVYWYKPSEKMQRISLVATVFAVFFVTTKSLWAILVFHALFFFASMLAKNSHKIVVWAVLFGYYLLPYVFPSLVPDDTPKPGPDPTPTPTPPPSVL